MSKFSIKDNMMNNISKTTDKANDLQAKESFNFKIVDIENLVPSKKNFYKLVDIEALANDIKENGIYHNLVVREIEDNKFEIISGERRYRALCLLSDNGQDKFKKVPCQVRQNINDTDTEIMLIQANARTRELTEVEKLKQIEKLEILYASKRGNGEIKGKTKELIASDLDMSGTQVGRYQKINKGLIPQLMNLIESESLTITNASLIATLPDENQIEIFNILKNNSELTKSETETLVKQVKLQNEKIQEELQKKIEEEKLKSEETRKIYESELDEAKINILQLEKDKTNLEKKKEESIKDFKTAENDLIILKSKLKEHEDKQYSIEEELKEKLSKEINEKAKNEIEILKEQIEKEKKKSIEIQKQLKDKKQNDDFKDKDKGYKIDIDNIKDNAELEVTLKGIVNSAKVITYKTVALKTKKFLATDDNIKLLDQVKKQLKEMEEALIQLGF